MATYNWSYKPGVTNKYGITIPASADNVKPSGIAYVALFGNDDTGNGSRQYPYRTLAFAKAANPYYTFILGAGVYRESIGVNDIVGSIIGDGEVIFDLFLGYFLVFGNGGGSLYNLLIRNASSGSEFNVMQNVFLDGNNLGNFTCQANIYQNIISNLNNLTISQTTSISPTTGFNTFINISNLVINASTTTQGSLNFCIFENCEINFQSQPSFDYCLFYNCSFKMNSGSYVSITDLATLQALIQTVYPTITPFTHCIFGNPLFNNPSIGDYTLQFSSPAKNASYFGTPIGAKSIAQSLLVSATESTGAFDFSTNVNLTVANNSITLVDTTQIGSIQTKVILNTIGREIAKLPTFGFYADRNGQYIDSILDLSASPINSVSTLNYTTPYLVQVAAIVYNGNTYQPGDRFTTDTTHNTFTTASGGVCAEILEAPERHTLMARFSNGDGTNNPGENLTSGYWYYVVGANIVYNTVTYTAGSLFKAIDTNTFTGTGTLIVAMSTETFQHYEIGEKPYTNNVGNVPTGAITYGSGDPNYNRGGINVTEFAVNYKFIQIKYILQVANLTP